MNENIITTFPIIETKRLRLREMEMNDTSLLLQLRSDERVMKYMAKEPIQTIDEARSMIKDIHNAFGKRESIYWAIALKDTDNLIGAGGYWRWVKQHFRAEIGFQLLPAYWRKGYMKEALGAMIQYGFDKMTLHRIEADSDPGNNASIKLLENLGFNREAHFKENIFFQGQYLDSMIYSLIDPREKD